MSTRLTWLPKWERPAYAIDIYRIFPRLVLLGYGVMAWQVSEWFMGLKDPTGAQAAFPSVVFGAIPLILNFYCQNGVDWEKRRNPTAAPVPGQTIATASVSTEAKS